MAFCALALQLPLNSNPTPRLISKNINRRCFPINKSSSMMRISHQFRVAPYGLRWIRPQLIPRSEYTGLQPKLPTLGNFKNTQIKQASWNETWPTPVIRYQEAQLVLIERHPKNLIAATR